MTTIITDSPEEAASYLRDGQTVAFPTETVYGLGADALDVQAVEGVFNAKGRPADNPLIVHVASIGQVSPLIDSISAEADQLMQLFFPGPLTIVLRKSAAVPPGVTAGLDTIAVRMPDHPIGRAFLEACGRPVAAPSANRSSRPSPTTWEAVRDELSGRIRCILKGGRSRVGLESTVVDCTSSPPAVLRPGAVSLEHLREAIPGIRLSTKQQDESGGPRSPGLRHRHYAPRARVRIVDHPPNRARPLEAYIGLDTPDAAFSRMVVCASVDEYAHELFEFFRSCDAEGIHTIFCQSVEENGIGMALMDRLRRASEAH